MKGDEKFIIPRNDRNSFLSFGISALRNDWTFPGSG